MIHDGGRKKQIENEKKFIIYPVSNIIMTKHYLWNPNDDDNDNGRNFFSNSQNKDPKTTKNNEKKGWFKPEGWIIFFICIKQIARWQFYTDNNDDDD